METRTTRAASLRRSLMPFVLTVWLAGALVPQAAAAIAAEADLQSAFEAMLADPGNTALTERYARVALEAADYEAAIGALEGLLMMSPELSRVRVDLGILYYRLDSTAAARYHLNRALSEGGLTREQSVRAEAFLVRVDDATDRHFFSGRVSGGLRFRSNANSGPDSATVRARGLDVVLDEEFQEEDDGDAFFVGNLKHTYDFKRQNSLVLESTAFLFANRQFDLDEFNNITFEVTSGPRFKPAPRRWKFLDIRPHAVFNVVYRDDAMFSNVYGAGVDVRYQTDKRLRLSGIFQHRQRDFDSNEDRPFVGFERDGHENYFSVDARYLVRDNFSVLARLDAIDRAAKADFNDSFELGLRVRGDWTYASPFAFAPGRWRFFVGGGWRDTDYDTANPRVDPTRIRDDREWRFNVGNAIPITGRLHAIIEVTGQYLESNIPNFERDNISTILSMSYWF